ncbi:hypothetical protein P171DRAFT_432316 [Karstenula rhodostoma CBS 690.94]|uniref:Uncharacterized protein n=1 Tax=Karstenula rhodostoma CBS 690.94 TaxID=1392251 RepID=A0A9P4PHU1_9PLEO|nr:hypothetical protein P171DRAFT_432316 [Karstenula rhodostoma CBS 690.94]
MVENWSKTGASSSRVRRLPRGALHALPRANKLVSIFLHVLEYFLPHRKPLLVPRPSQESISRSYPALTASSRRSIWAIFLVGLDVPQEWGESDVDELATVELNGMQIKNVLKSAALPSARRKKSLGRRFVDTVLAIERRRPGLHEGS